MKPSTRHVKGELINPRIVNKRGVVYDWSILERNGDYVVIRLYPLGSQPQNLIKPAFAYAKKTHDLKFSLELTIFEKDMRRWLRVERRDDAE